MTYSEKLKDPRWQKKRLEVFQRDEFTCQICGDTENMLMVHHRIYLPDCDPWEYPDHLLITLCENCHEAESRNRLNINKALLNALYEKFFTDDIQSLILGFSKMDLQHSSDVVASAYEFALSSPQIQSEILKKFWKSLTYNAKSHS